LNEVDYDAATFSIAWTKIADPIATGYAIAIRAPGSTSLQTAGDVGHTSFAFQADTALTYTLGVAATAGIVTGPLSSDVTAIVVPPAAANVRTPDGTAMKAYFTALTGVPNVTGYEADLLTNGVVTEQPAGAASPIAFAATLTAGIAYYAKVRATGVKAKGPFTSLAPGPFLTNTVYAYDRAGRLQSVAWDAHHTITYTFDPAGNITTAAWTTS
jgi:YD repeat-containing protein